MSETIRCTSCRGAKKVPKLGGVIGECNTCGGKGTILAVDKVKQVMVEVVDKPQDVIQSVAASVRASDMQEQVDRFKKAEVNLLNDIVDKAMPLIKVDDKKVLYKRKTTTK